MILNTLQKDGSSGLRKNTKKMILLVSAAAALAAPAPAGAKLLAATYNEGLEPHAVLQGKTKALPKPKSITVEFSGLIREAVMTGNFKVVCLRGSKTAFSRTFPLMGATPARRTVAIQPGFDSCRVATASARFADPFVEGSLQIRATGKSG